MAISLDPPVSAPDGAAARAPADREDLARRLIRAAATKSYNPDTDIEWPASLANDRFFLPEHLVSLYGTRLWTQMSPEQRILLSRHEVASMAQAGVWFELILGQLLIRFIYDEDYLSLHTRWALTEIADECRHSTMFARLADVLAGHEHRPEPLTIILGRLLKTIGTPVEGFADILIAEEILDMIQREAMADQSIQPLIRAVSQLHVTEEARHVKFAREELERRVHRMNRAQLLRARAIVAISGVVVADALVHPSCYAAAGLNVREAQQVARRSPHRIETLRWSASKVTEFFTDIGLIAGPARHIWTRAGLLPA